MIHGEMVLSLYLFLKKTKERRPKKRTPVQTRAPTRANSRTYWCKLAHLKGGSEHAETFRSVRRWLFSDQAYGPGNRRPSERSAHAPAGQACVRSATRSYGGAPAPRGQGDCGSVRGLGSVALYAPSHH